MVSLKKPASLGSYSITWLFSRGRDGKVTVISAVCLAVFLNLLVEGALILPRWLVCSVEACLPRVGSYWLTPEQKIFVCKHVIEIIHQQRHSSLCL